MSTTQGAPSIERRYVPARGALTIRTIDGEERITGHAAVFNRDSLDLGGFIEQVAPGAFSGSLAGVRSGSETVHAFWNHDSGQPLASTRSGKLVLKEDATGLWFSLPADRLTLAQRSAIKDGDMQTSFGFMTLQDEWTRGGHGQPDRRTLLDVELHEISIVSKPAYPDTAVALRSRDTWRGVHRQDDPLDMYKRRLRVIEATLSDPVPARFTTDAERRSHMNEISREIAQSPTRPVASVSHVASADALRRAAYHEAGHVVVGCALGVTVYRVEVHDDGSGRTQLAASGGGPAATAAGVVAERIAGYTVPEQSKRKHYASVRRQAKHIAGFSETRTRELVDHAFDWAENILRERWASVELIAAALLRRRSLDEHALLEILGKSAPVTLESFNVRHARRLGHLVWRA